jgi:hypothetical protein
MKYPLKYQINIVDFSVSITMFLILWWKLFSVTFFSFMRYQRDEYLLPVKILHIDFVTMPRYRHIIQTKLDMKNSRHRTIWTHGDYICDLRQITFHDCQDLSENPDDQEWLTAVIWISSNSIHSYITSILIIYIIYSLVYQQREKWFRTSTSSSRLTCGTTRSVNNADDRMLLHVQKFFCIISLCAIFYKRENLHKFWLKIINKQVDNHQS